MQAPTAGEGGGLAGARRCTRRAQHCSAGSSNWLQLFVPPAYALTTASPSSLPGTPQPPLGGWAHVDSLRPE